MENGNRRKAAEWERAGKDGTPANPRGTSIFRRGRSIMPVIQLHVRVDGKTASPSPGIMAVAVNIEPKDDVALIA